MVTARGVPAHGPQRVGRDAVLGAAARIVPFVQRTPIVASGELDRWLGVTTVCKSEHRQRGGSFKLRGATNAVQSLATSEAARGVAAHSSGNHAAALAIAAADRGIPCHVVMPRTAPAVKREAVLRHGASIVECDPTETARIETLRSVVARTGAVEVHPYDDDQVIAGAGTAALELLDEAPGLDWLVVPVGGGGLASGTCIAAGGTAVLGTEPAGADDAARSLAAGRLLPQTAPETIADGLLTSLSPRTFGVLRGHGIRIVTVTDDETRAALAVVADATGQRIEPSSAVALAGLRRAVRAGIVDPAALVGLIITGGNV